LLQESQPDLQFI